LRRYLKYFTGSSGAMGDDYKGGRDFDALSAWAKENLGPSCGAENIDLCDDEQKAGWSLITSSRHTHVVIRPWTLTHFRVCQLEVAEGVGYCSPCEAPWGSMNVSRRRKHSTDVKSTTSVRAYV